MTVKLFWSDSKRRQRFFYLTLGLVLLYAAAFTSGVKQTDYASQPEGEVTRTTFATEPITVNETLLSNEASASSSLKIPVRIVIPDVSLDVAVRQAPVVKGYWQVFEDAAGFGSGSAFSGEKGNQVIFAHAREKLFLPLRDVKKGQNIYVFTDDAWYGYRVEEIKEVKPDQKEVIAPTSDETLTLYTCTGFGDSKRLIVIGKREKH